MLSALLDPRTQLPRTRLFWAVLGALALAQLVALGLLCSHQVRKAEARQAEHTVHQLALADCLRYIPGATIATCTNRLAAQEASDGALGPARAATPVSFTFR